MTRRHVVSTVVLLILVAVLGRLVYARAYRVFFTARPAPLAAPFTTEEAWIVDEIARDITEMSRRTTDVSPTILTAAQPGTYAVSVDGLASPVTVDLSRDLWSPSGFAALASALIGADQPTATVGEPVTVHDDLLELTTATLLDANDTVSRALQANLRDGAAHEAAALTVAAFALREPAGRQADTRWAMNRTTAHLAMALALRNGRLGTDGRLADALLLIFTNQQVRALAALDALEAEVSTEAVGAWGRALRLRVTEDWRALPDPRTATRLEQREYFRARRVTIRTVTGSSELERLGRAMDIDWIRLINASPAGVEDMSLVTDTLAMEQAELDDVYRRLHGQPLVNNETAALNALATRCMSSRGPQVLSWGGWAEFGQRRLAAVIARYDSYLRHSLGSADAADTVKAKLHDQLGALWTFPASTIWWTKGPRGKEADDRYFSEAVTEALTHPQRATVRVWTLLDFAGPYTQMRRFIAPPQGWFVATAPRSAYEAAVRMEASGLRPVQDLEQLLKDAPYDVGLVYPYLIAKHGKTIPFDVLTTRFGERMRYDTRVIGTAIEAAGESDQGLDLLATACTVSQGYCSTLGYQLARRGRDAEAVKAYERLLNDEGVDSVSKANWSGWLVDYYQAQGRTGPALKLAEESAGTGAAAGLITAGRLYERLGRMDDAESSFRSSAERYDAPADLIAFYYRAVAVRKDAGYQPAWQRELERVFPNGLVEGAGPDGPPTTGVFIESDSAAARAVGLQAGDVIVAVDGWRVENMPQYRVVRAFPLAGGFTLTVARGPARLPVKVANSAFTPQFTIADYPVQGWIEK